MPLTPDDDQFGYHQCFGTLVDAGVLMVSGEDEPFDAAAGVASAVATGVVLDGVMATTGALAGVDAAGSAGAVAAWLTATGVEALEQPDKTAAQRSATVRRAFMMRIIPIFTN